MCSVPQASAERCPSFRAVAIAFAHHAEAAMRVAGTPAQVFARLDDHRRLASHMESPSMAMAGVSMRLVLDGRQGRGVGARIGFTGKAFGVPLAVDEEVVAYEPPESKVWQTVGEPRLLVIGSYRMGFSVAPVDAGWSSVRVWIDYDLPARGFERWAGALAGGFYAGWCVRRMLQEVAGA